MKRIIRLTERDLTRIVKHIINEQAMGLDIEKSPLDSQTMKEAATCLREFFKDAKPSGFKVPGSCMAISSSSSYLPTMDPKRCIEDITDEFQTNIKKYPRKVKIAAAKLVLCLTEGEFPDEIQEVIDILRETIEVQIGDIDDVINDVTDIFLGDENDIDMDIEY